MFSNCTCQIKDNTYRFSARSLSFERALTACTNEGGRLARFLTMLDYEELNSCCSQEGEYWIGLVDKRDCPHQNDPYRWDNTLMCRNAEPLAVITQPNNSGCQGVTIRTGSQQVLPTARVIDCIQPQQFICQYLSTPPTTTATKTSISTNATNNSTTLFSSNQLSSIISSFPFFFRTSPTTIASSTQSERNAAIISSIILANIILLLLLAIFCFWRSKKNESAQMKSTSGTPEQPGPFSEQLELTLNNGNQQKLCQK